MRTFLTAGTAMVALTLGVGAPAFACGALIGPNGAVQLGKTTTLAAYHDGVEHYITSFEFAGGEGEFGSIVPLPGVPTLVEKGGDWTLQRLVREVTPVQRSDFAAAPAAAEADAVVLQQVQIDALEITILEGGGRAVGDWARENGFILSPDVPEALDFYAERSPIFMAAKFDADAARDRGQQIGDGTPIHLTIPTDRPWVPLRILGVGLAPTDIVEADVFLLTDARPNLLPGNVDGVTLARSEAANDSLISDLRSDAGMEWVPDQMWLSYLELNIPASALTFDLAIDPTGTAVPSAVDAGLGNVPTAIARALTVAAHQPGWLPAMIAALIALALLGAAATTPRSDQ